MAKRQFQDTHGLEQMQAYQATISGQGDLTWKPDVNTFEDLPSTGNKEGDTRLVKETGWTYRYTSEGWSIISGGGGGSAIVDTVMSDSSTNAVQNKTIKKYVDDGLAEKQDEIDSSHKLDADLVDDSESTNKFVTSSDVSNWNGKQDELVSGENIKTINNQSILGEGNIDIEGGSSVWGQISGDIEDQEDLQAELAGKANTIGEYPQMHVGLADNLYTSDNIVDVDSWNFRTTAGSESVPSSGTASLNYIKGKMVRTNPNTEAQLSFTASTGIFVRNVNKTLFIATCGNTTGTYTFTLSSGTWGTDPATYGLTVTLQQDEFTITGATWSDTGTAFKTYVSNNRGTFTLTYEDSSWTLSNGETDWTNVDPATDLGIADAQTTTPIYINYYDECTDGTLTASFTAETRTALTIANPTQLLATGVNQYDGTTKISNVEIDSNGEIVSGNNTVVYVYAYGGVTNGYMAYSSNGYIVNCGWSATLPTTGTTLTQTGINVTTTSCSMPFANTGYFVIEVSDDTDLSVHPKWSGQQDTNTDAYTTSTVSIPTSDRSSTSLPTASYGMPALGDVYDELNGQTQQYIKRIGQLSYSSSNLAIVAVMGVPFDYDTTNIFYVLETPVIYDISFTNTYTANDYGTERLLDSNDDIIALEVEVSTSYGSNLVDKLRTGVVTKEEYPQVITQTAYDNLPATKNTDGVIRFIYTEE